MPELNLNPFAISGLLIATAYFPLFLLIAIKGQTRLARIYSLHIFSVAIWGIGSFLSSINADSTSAMFLLKFAFSGVIFIPVFFYHSVLILLRRKALLILLLIYAQAFYFLYMNLIGRMYSVKFFSNSFYFYDGNLFYLLSFIIWSLIASIAHLELIQFYRLSHPEQKKQIFFLMLAVTGFAGGVFNFLPGLDIEILPYGNFLIPIHSFIVTYAILKHQLLNIQIVMQKSIAYAFLIAFISGLYLVIIVILEKSLQGFVGYQSVALSAIVAFLFGIIFIPMRNKIQHAVDRLFFHGTQIEIAEENERLRQKILQSEKMKAIAMLASGMAHEIKNPLTAIRTFSEYLPRKLDDKEFLRKFSKLAMTEVDRINNLVYSLLDFAKPTPPTLKKTDMHHFLDATIEFLNSNLIKKHIEVFKRYQAQDPHLNIDPGQFRQAILNIILNAIEAMDTKGTLVVSTERELGPGNKKIFRIKIRDSGPGIAPEDLPHIFEPFFSKKDDGTGLGLSVTKSVIAEHKGILKVESEADAGTEFTIEIPF